MSRLRLIFLATAVLLIVPSALLVRHAVLGLRIEHELRHRAVADRVFDEMERALTRWLSAEEARPIAHYRFYADDRPGGAAVLSPLAEGPTLPFVLGYFQIDPDGSFHTPERPRDPEAAEERGDYAPDPERERFLESLERRIGAYLAVWNADGPRADADALVPSPTEAAAVEEEVETDLYSALSSLNRASEARRGRKSQLLEAAPEEPGARAESYAAAPPEISFGADAWTDGFASPKSSERALRAEPGRLPAAAAAKRDRPSTAAAPRRRAVSIRIDPMRGALLDDGSTLILTRRVTSGGVERIQGVAVEAAALFRWLEGEALADARLGGAELAFRVAGSPVGATDDGRFRTVYRFAEPFDSWEVEQSLVPLSDPRAETPILALYALFLAASAGGLFALYRMVAARWAFAERRSNFASAVSHELKTPVTAIRMFAEMLGDGLVSSEAKRKEYYATIRAESERLTRLIDNVLGFSRLERDPGETHGVVGDLGPVLEEAAEQLTPHATHSGFALELRMARSRPEVYFDRDALLQILFNLIDNAIKYAAGGEPRTVHLTCGPGEAGLVVAVRDHGAGVPPEQLDRIFEPFYRGTCELTRTAKGTGIGLALASRLAASMGARLSARNLREGGFEAVLVFPFPRAEEAA